MKLYIPFDTDPFLHGCNKIGNNQDLADKRNYCNSQENEWSSQRKECEGNKDEHE